MANHDYARGYCRAYATHKYVIVNHHVTDKPADIATAARECNYLNGNWGHTRLVNIGTGRKPRGRAVTFYQIEPV